MKRLVLILLCVGLAAQVPAPTQINLLDTSTTVWSPYPADTPSAAFGAVGPFAWGATYNDPDHTSSGNPIIIARLPNITANCTSKAWSSSAFRPFESVTYGGGYWYVPYTAGVSSQANVTLTTNAVSAAGTNVLYFASTATLSASRNYLITGTNIPANTVYTTFGGTSVTLSNNLTGTGVASGAAIVFSNPPSADGGVTALAPWHQAANQAETCLVRGIVPSYGSRQAWNIDNSEFYVFSTGGGLSSGAEAYFYNNTTNPPTIDFQFDSTLTGAISSDPGSFAGTNGDETWSHSDRTKIVFMNNNVSPSQMRQLDISAKSVSTVHTYDFTGVECPAGTNAVNNGGTGNPSKNDRYWAQGCSIGGSLATAPRQLIIYDKLIDKVVVSVPITSICGSNVGIDWLGMTPDGDGVIVNWDISVYENTWTTCTGSELFSFVPNTTTPTLGTLTSEGMIMATDCMHCDVGYDINGYQIVEGPHYSRPTSSEPNWNYWTLDVTKLSEVHPPPYGATNTTSYVRRYFLPCTFYSGTNPTDPYNGCTGSVVGGTNSYHTSGRAMENPASYGQALISTYPINQTTEEPGWGRGEAFVVSIDTNLPSEIVLTTNGATSSSSNVLHFASTVPTGGLYALVGGGAMRVTGSHIDDNTFLASFDGTTATLSKPPTTTGVTSGTSIRFYVPATFHRASRTGAARLDATSPRCTGGDDYWQEPHATANRTLTQFIFASSWLTQCGQVMTGLVNLPGVAIPTPSAALTGKSHLSGLARIQ